MENAKSIVEHSLNTADAMEYMETTAARTSPVVKRNQADNKTTLAVADDNTLALALLVLHNCLHVGLQLKQKVEQWNPMT